MRIFVPGRICLFGEHSDWAGGYRRINAEIGKGNGPASRLVASGAFDVMQICYNLIFQHPYDPSRRAGLIYEAEAQGMGIITMQTFTSGIFQKWLSHIFPLEMSDLSRQKILNKGLLSFVLSNPLIVVALVGMRTIQEVEENRRACDELRYHLDLDKLHTRYV